jgi:hypothetical protein
MGGGLLGNPHNESQFIIFVTPGNLPTSRRGKVQTIHHVGFREPDTYGVGFVCYERWGSKVQASACNLQLWRAVYTPVITLSPPAHFGFSPPIRFAT